MWKYIVVYNSKVVWVLGPSNRLVVAFTSTKKFGGCAQSLRLLICKAVDMSFGVS